MRGDPALRVLLDRATQDVTEQEFAEYWKAIVESDGCTVTEVAEESCDRLSFNCFAYALRIERLPDFQYLATAGSAVANSCFMEDLKRNGLLKVRAARSLAPGKIVLYYNGEKLTHAARIGPQGVLTSKWGMMAVFRHRLWEVPACFGDRFEVASAPEPSVSVSALCRWQGIACN
jgi:hypothetical protein